jgi:hypothetical protein
MSAPKDAIALACGTLLSRGVPAGKVLEVEARLRRIARGGIGMTVELPEHGIAVTLPPAGGARRRHLHRPGRVS